MTSFQARIRADARLTMLQILSKDQGFSMNHELLGRYVDHLTAITLKEAEVKAHLAWLEDQGLVTTEIVGPYVQAKLTDLGLKVAQGAESAEGVSRPRPGDI